MKLLNIKKEFIRHFTLISMIFCATILLISCSSTHRNIETFYKETTCYDRQNEPYTAVVDSHIHFRAFGGRSIPFNELNDYFRNTSVRFANIYGIGQVVPADSDCTYYLDCPGTLVLPSIKNDFINAGNLVESAPEGIHLTLSMTFADMANLDDSLATIALYDKEYPGMFKWAGEINLVKQALFQNGQVPVTREDIDKWGDFMGVLQDRDIPVNFHSDLGNDDDPTKYLGVMEYVLEKFQDNKIIWAHMGLSKELANMDPDKHTMLLKGLLDAYPNLMLDISWDVLNKHYFSKPKIRAVYIDFFNGYSDRILPGTDFVASRNKSFKTYKNELLKTSSILEYLSDESFRDIALGQNYFIISGLNYVAPEICNKVN